MMDSGLLTTQILNTERDKDLKRQKLRILHKEKTETLRLFLMEIWLATQEVEAVLPTLI
jgi:hypothetical protein